jgi:hypothetical protein
MMTAVPATTSANMLINRIAPIKVAAKWQNASRRAAVRCASYAKRDY